MAVSPGSAVSLNQISLRRRLGGFESDSLMVIHYGNMGAGKESRGRISRMARTPPARRKAASEETKIKGDDMLFLTPSLMEKRSKLFRQVERGALTAAQGFRR